jgi:uncharacterized protein YbaA (DUF1428 family)
VSEECCARNYVRSVCQQAAAATLPVDGKRMFWGGFKTLLEL